MRHLFMKTKTVSHQTSNFFFLNSNVFIYLRVCVRVLPPLINSKGIQLGFLSVLWMIAIRRIRFLRKIAHSSQPYPWPTRVTHHLPHHIRTFPFFLHIKCYKFPRHHIFFQFKHYCVFYPIFLSLGRKTFLIPKSNMLIRILRNRNH